MRIVDVCAFYTPTGGGVRTYVDAKLRTAARFGHEMIVIAPGERDCIERRGPGAIVVSIASPPLPVDRRYRYFHDQRALHQALDAWSPDHVEASSPWSSATMVGRWQGVATRSLVMHADPLAAYAYRWLGGIARTETIDRWFGAFWRHLRGLGRMFDAVICANRQFTQRLRAGGLSRVETIAMGIEDGRFSPALRSPELRAALLRSIGLDPAAVLLVGIGRFAAEKRWELVVRAVQECARDRPVGFVLVGDGPRRRKIELAAARTGRIAIMPRLDDRNSVARLIASADALVHGCEAETFCLVAAEARASGIPLIVPDRGAALDQLAPNAGLAYRAASERDLQSAIQSFLERGVELQRAAVAAASPPGRVRTLDDHFAELFARYGLLARCRAWRPADFADSEAGELRQLALAGTAARHARPRAS